MPLGIINKQLTLQMAYCNKHEYIARKLGGIRYVKSKRSFRNRMRSEIQTDLLFAILQSIIRPTPIKVKALFPSVLTSK